VSDAGGTAIEAVARRATGRLVALLARRSGDLALAEDALSDALVAALQSWPEAGVPDDPEAWLFAVARRKLVGVWRKADVRRRKAAAIRELQTLEVPQTGGRGWPDERLPLLFVCAHPAIDPALRAPLMLQAVLGLTADDIGPLMGVSGKAMGQRLWRAKKKIRDAGIPFAVPEGPELDERVGAVLDAVYALYGAGWARTSRSSWAQEAGWLAQVVVELLPDEAEALGLLALVRYVEARRATGRTDAHAFVPLDEQDPAAWDEACIQEADEALSRAQAQRDIGPFQLEAAIQSAVVHGRRRGRVDHDAVLALYDGLVALAPTLGAQVGRAAAIAEARGPAAGLAALDDMAEVEVFQPWWAVRAALLAAHLEAGTAPDPEARAEAERAFARALELTEDPAVRAFLEGGRARLR